MRFGSVCSGIEAASVAWEPLGWKAAWFSEIKPFPSAVLAHHHPDTPNLGDMVALPAAILAGDVEAPDVLCGGTPCQAFSVAGLRQSLDDARGNLSLTFCEIADAIDDVRRNDGRAPAIVFWENVPGVLSTKDNAFGCFLAGLAGESEPLLPAGPRWTDAGAVFGPERAVAWRILDAQYFGLAQRRRRVFVVASARKDFDPAAVLLEFAGVRRDSAPSRAAGKVAPTIPSRSTAGGGLGTDFDCDGGVVQHKQWPADVAPALDTTLNKYMGYDNQHVNGGCGWFGPGPAHAMRGEGFDDSEDGSTHAMGCGSTQGNATVAIALQTDATQKACVELAFTLNLPSSTGGGQPAAAMTPAMPVRRLTPVECERLQGFPDGYTAIPWRGKPASECPDGPRYKALGNSWAVPVVRWIGQRIQEHINE